MPSWRNSAEAMRRLLILALAGLAGLPLAGCATLDALGAPPRPVGEITPQPGEHPCVEFAEDMYGRTYCRKELP